MMEQLARVTQIQEDGRALVSVVRQSACSGDCHQCSGCGAVQQTLRLRAVNAIGARPGELVTIQSDSGTVLAGAAVLYLMPLALFFVGYLVGMSLWSAGALTGCLAFFAGIAVAVAYDRLVARKKQQVYTITGYPDIKTSGTQTKGDNDLD